MKYVFRFGPVDGERLKPQIGAALEMRTEMLSRAKYPGMWRMTDRMSGAGPSRPRSRGAQAASGILYLAAALVLLIPGLARFSEQPTLALVGAAVLVYGVVKLLPARRQGRDASFDRAAGELVERMTAAQDPDAAAVFDEEGMSLPMGGGTVSRVAYGDMECAVETEDAILAVYDGRAVILQKRDLEGAPAGEFCRFLQERVAAYRSVVPVQPGDEKSNL